MVVIAEKNEGKEIDGEESGVFADYSTDNVVDVGNGDHEELGSVSPAGDEVYLGGIGVA